METNGRNRVYQRPRPASGGQSDRAAVCFHWQAERCNRRPCPFRHSHLSIPTARDLSPSTSKQAQSLVWRRNPNPISVGGNGTGPNPNRGDHNCTGGPSPNGGNQGLVWRRNPKPNPISTGGNGTGRPDPKGGDHNCTGGPNPNGGHQSLVWRRNPNPNHVSTGGNGTSIGPDGGKLCSHGENTNAEKRSIGGGGACTSKGATPCEQFLSGTCPSGDMCPHLRTQSIRDDFSLLTLLDGHQKAITAIELPSGSGKLYSSSKDGTLKVWDCSTGQCTATFDMGGEIGCLLSDGQWFFVGIRNSIKVYHIQTGAEMTMSGPTGLVCALAADDGMLFAGTQHGAILVWRFSAATNLFEPAASLIGHGDAVVSIIIGGATLYSSSLDHTIKAWDLATLECVHTLSDHTDAVMSLLCWGPFLLSCSLDNTIKVWARNDKGELEVRYTRTEEHGVLALRGMDDSEGKPVLFCSRKDKVVCLYDLPSFEERGRIFAKQEVRGIHTGPAGLFFTGDGSGELKVWKWSEN